MRIRIELIIGIVLVSVAFGALYMVANVINPPAQNVLVATHDIQPGEVLVQSMIELVPVNLPSTDMFITEDDISRFSGAVAVEVIHKGELLHMASFVERDNPAAAERAALALDDPKMVAFVVPVSEETAPPNIQQGDRVNLVLGIGGSSYLSSTVSLLREAESSDMTNVDMLESRQETDISNGATTLDAFDTGDDQHYMSESLTLPIAKTLVRRARVLQVVYKNRPDPAYTGEAGQEAYLSGEIKAIVLAVPEDSQELLTFALSNGEVRIALCSPLADEGEQVTMGMSWQDLGAYFVLERIQGMSEMEFEQMLAGPGANLLWTRWLAEREAERRRLQTPTPPTLPEIAAPTDETVD